MRPMLWGENRWLCSVCGEIEYSPEPPAACGTCGGVSAGPGSSDEQVVSTD